MELRMKKKKREYDWLEDVKRKRVELRGRTSTDMIFWFVVLGGLGLAAIAIWYYGPLT